VSRAQPVDASVAFHFTPRDAVRATFLYYFLRGRGFIDRASVSYNGEEFKTPGHVSIDADFYYRGTHVRPPRPEAVRQRAQQLRRLLPAGAAGPGREAPGRHSHRQWVRGPAVDRRRRSSARDDLFTRDKPVIFAFHGYPWLIHRLTYRRTNHDNIHVRGYKEEGTTTTPFDMVVLNDLDRFHLVDDVINRVPGLAVQMAYVKQMLRERPA